MPGKIFINYRREDTRADAARIRDRLVSAFGAINVFMDVDNLMAGQRFDQELAKALAETDIFLAVMGASWPQILYDRAQAGGRDYVREEIAQALARGIVVIPVMIERAPLPPQDWLPEDLKALVLHQKHDISHDRFGRDVGELVAAIKTARGVRSGGGGSAGRAMKWAAGAAAALVVAGGATTYAYKVYVAVSNSVPIIKAPSEPARVAPEPGARTAIAIEVARELQEAAAAKQRADNEDLQRTIEARRRGEVGTRAAEGRETGRIQDAEAQRMAAAKAATAERQGTPAAGPSSAPAANEHEKSAGPDGVRRIPTVTIGRNGQPSSAAPKANVGYVASFGFQKSLIDAMRLMADLQQKYEILRDKRLEVVQSDQTARGLGVIYRIVAGPRGSIEAVHTLCGQLYDAGMPKQRCSPLGE